MPANFPEARLVTDAYARGTLVGLTRGTTRAHIAHATLDAIAFQSRDVLDAMRAELIAGWQRAVERTKGWELNG
ncbi:MAG: hypothetical protein JXJ20_02925 [Anaerolineae bacterium]|nr:hypothetical protein [Anaerolineae bacterium]